MTDAECERFVWRIARQAFSEAGAKARLPDVLKADSLGVQNAWVRVFSVLNEKCK